MLISKFINKYMFKKYINFLLNWNSVNLIPKKQMEIALLMLNYLYDN